MSKNQLVFVYGTLRSGFWNNTLLHKSVKLGNGVTMGKNFIMGGNGIPYVDTTDREETAGRIVGEVWEVDAPTLANLDRLEGHPTWYERRVVEVVCQGEIVKAWMYHNSAAHEYELSRYMEEGVLVAHDRFYNYVKGMKADAYETFCKDL